MFSISKHLKSLLLEHNCVIVPDLGGFVAQYVPARYDQESQKFYPPTRLVAFNADLQMNDGLLVQSLMQTYDATFPEMQKAVEDKVADIKDQLFTIGHYDIAGIGRLSPNVEGRTEFEPAQDGLVSPGFYGLEYISAQPLKQSDKGTNLSRGLIRREGNGYVVRIHRNVANAAAAAVCGLFCYFSWNAPASSDASQPHEAQLFMTEAFASQPKTIQAEAKKDADFNEASANVRLSLGQQKKAVSDAVRKAVALQAQKAEVVPSASKPFTIVLVGGLSQAYAEAFIERLQAAGMNDGRIETNGRDFSVHYSAFASFAEAATFLSENKTVDGFQYGWVKEVK
ncbi:MAG: hypothetical protein IKI05_02605 [Bacteroidaceae bacterium]|nr:hypothetical protein [Bacteroidaceae bacterium]